MKPVYNIVKFLESKQDELTAKTENRTEEENERIKAIEVVIKWIKEGLK